MNYSDTLRKLLDARPGLTMAEIMDATGWTKQHTQSVLYNLQWSKEVQALPKRFSLTESIEQKAERKRQAALAYKQRELERLRSRRQAEREAREEKDEPFVLPSDSRAANEAMVRSAKAEQHPLAMAWRVV